MDYACSEFLECQCFDEKLCVRDFKKRIACWRITHTKNCIEPYNKKEQLAQIGIDVPIVSNLFGKEV